MIKLLQTCADHRRIRNTFIEEVALTRNLVLVVLTDKKQIYMCINVNVYILKFMTSFFEYHIIQ